MRRVWLALLIASLGWGTAGVATRVVLDEGVGPYTVAALRSALAAVVVVVFLVARRSGVPRAPGGRWGGSVWSRVFGRWWRSPRSPWAACTPSTTPAPTSRSR